VHFAKSKEVTHESEEVTFKDDEEKTTKTKK